MVFIYFGGKSGAIFFCEAVDNRGTSITAMCVDLMWNSLYTRSYLKGTTMLFKIYHALVLVINIAADDRTRWHNEYRLRILLVSCLIYQTSFYIRPIPMWNALNQRAVAAAVAEAFQRPALPVTKSGFW